MKKSTKFHMIFNEKKKKELLVGRARREGKLEKCFVFMEEPR